MHTYLRTHHARTLTRTRAHTDNPNELAIVFFFGNDYILEFVNELVLLYVRIMEHVCRVCMDVFCEFVNELVLLYVRIMEHVCRVCMDVFCVCSCV
jgi:hypothetical protein